MFSFALVKSQLILLALPIFVAQHLNQNNEIVAKSARNRVGFSPSVNNGTFNTVYNFKVNSSIVYTYEYKHVAQFFINQTARISVESISATKNYPVLIVVRQQKGVLSWQLPLIVGTHSNVDNEYHKVSRTLCPSKYYLQDNRESQVDEEESVIVTISTSNPVDVSVTLLVVIIDDFYLSLSVKRNITVSPSEPHFYGFNFDNDTETALILVDSNDEICTTLSIQSINCPVFDLERNVQFEGQWETMSTKGGITLKRESYPNGFYVVFVVKGDDWECTGKEEELLPHRNKTLTFVLEPGITEKSYLIAILSTLALFAVVYLFSGSVLLFYMTRKRSVPTDSGILSSTIDEDIMPGAISGTNTNDISTHSSLTHHRLPSQAGSDSSLDEDDIDVMLDVEHDKDVFRTKTALHVCDLSRKNPRALQMKSQQYLWSLLTVGVFYALPVVQLVFTYQTVLNQTGNEDLCYYNFRCSHPFGLLSDVNHVFSNVGYVFLGLLFILITVRRENLHKNQRQNRNEFGIPQHFGLFYAMGAALIMEGILSASYHVCPNHSNFQFDTSFMYVISVLCMVKIYQNRHPDINARAYATFSALAGVTFIGMWGVIGPSTLFWIFFTALHLITCLLLSAQIYYMRRWTIELKAIKRVVRMWFSQCRQRPLENLKPKYPNRMVLLVLGNLCNWGLASYGILYHFSDFATYLLTIFMANLILYCMFYIVMKLCNRERILFQPSVYIILSFITWGAALFFFFQKSISWKLTPAKSREYNQPCKILNFYDKHDIWHFLSAASMFFSFMVLLTLDDDLVDTSREIIPVF